MSSTKGLEWTFNTEPEKYEKMRPGYVSALYEDIFRAIPLHEASNAMEIGIGAGQATPPILKTGCQLTAVEYGDKLTELCRQKFQAFPNFSVVNSKFEDFESSDNTYDLIYSATAFHWIPEEIGYAKVFEMLKSGGVFARFANHPYKDKGREGLHQAIQKIYSVYMPNSHAPDEYLQENAKNLADLAGKYGFVDLSYHLYHRTRNFTTEEYLALLGTYSDHIALEENIQKQFYSEMRDAIDSFGGEITIYDTIDLELARKP